VTILNYETIRSFSQSKVCIM